jgi:uncharacterized membrane protein YedE/YeeE
MQPNSFSYTLKVWLTSVFLAPVIYLVIESGTKTNSYLTLGDYMNEQIASYTICVIFGGLFSSLTWVLFYLCTKVILLFYASDHIRYFFVVLGLVLTAGTFAVFLPSVFNVHDEFFYLMTANCICIASAAAFYKLDVKKVNQ